MAYSEFGRLGYAPSALTHPTGYGLRTEQLGAIHELWDRWSDERDRFLDGVREDLIAGTPNSGRSA